MLYYFISSSYDYCRTTLPFLMVSLPYESESLKYVIVICNSPFEKTERLLVDGRFATVYYVSWNAWEQSSLIVGCNILKDDEYGFLLHDTCKAGENFHSIISSFQTKECDLVDVYNGYCNFGLYRGSFLRSQKEFLLSCIGVSKERAIDNEFYLFDNAKKKLRFYPRTKNGDYKRLGQEDVYKTGNIRLVEHYENVDLYKFKANWGRKSIYNVGV